MGNVPISCCKSKSPRIGYEGDRRNIGGANSDYDSRRKLSNRFGQGEHDLNDPNLQATHNLQHISEREPDDSDTDPSSNPYNRPIFATRSTSKSRSGNYTDSYSSTYSPNRCVTHTPLTSSQDQGYNSGTSTNLNSQQDGQLLNHSFETNISQGERPRARTFELGNSSSYSNSLYHDDLSSGGGGNRIDRDYLVSSTQSTDIEQTLSPLRRLSLRRSCNHTPFTKVSSCSTIFVNDSTISQPNLTQTIRCVSLAIYYHIRNRTSDSSIEIFDETVHPLRMPAPTTPDADDDDKILDLQKDDMPLGPNEPDIWTIYRFVNTLFKSAQLTSEYAITTLVYLERLMTYTEMDLAPKTWRRMFLGAILLSSKVWEDQAVWNVDYAQILEGISVEDINELERQFLELIQFNMNVPSSVYAKYYFHLRTLALKNGLGHEQTLLTVCKAKDLEAMSRGFAIDWQSSPIQRKSSSILRRHTSLEKTRLSGQTKAVLM